LSGRYSRYLLYKSSPARWQDDIPLDWNTIPIGRMFRRVKYTGFPEEQLLSVYRDYGAIPKSSRDDNFNKASEDLSAYQLVRPGNLVMNKMKAWQGSIAISEHRGIVSPAYFVYESWRRDDHRMNSKYIHYLLRSPAYITQYLSQSKGIRISQWDLDPAAFERIEILLPPLDEQAQIAKFLDYETAKIDALIAKQQQLIALLQEKRQAVISHAVTKGLNPAAPLRDSGVAWLGQVPAHWEEYPLKALFGLKHGYAFDSTKFSDSGKFILMTPGNFNERGGFRHKIPEKFYTGTDIPKDFILKSGQLLVAMTEQGPGLLGCALFVPEQGTYLHNQRLGLVHKIRSDKVSVQYLFHLFNSSRYRAEVSVSSTGAKVQHTSPAKILSIKIWLPPLSEQELIARFVDDRIAKVDTLEVKAEQTIQLLHERRTALISAAVTGKIDVRGWQPPPAAAAGGFDEPHGAKATVLSNDAG
jgi:type I restriction enzyme S subunit